jgi:uncharacterized coiled-coil DUF342 family protein
MNYYKVEGHDSLIRDSRTGAIINTDKSVFEDIRKIRNNNLNMKRLYSDVDDLKNELADIKNLLRELIKNGN